MSGSIRSFYTKQLISYTAVAPENGTIVARNYEKANTEAMLDFLKQVDLAVNHNPVLMIMDRAAWHTTTKLDVPDNIKLLFLPPTSPQLNPVEHLWKHIRSEKFHNIIFETIADVCTAVNKAISHLSAEKIKSLCACSYL